MPDPQRGEVSHSRAIVNLWNIVSGQRAASGVTPAALFLLRLEVEQECEARQPGGSSSGPRIQTLAGQVQSVNRRDNSFALDHRPGQVVLVLLSQNVRESDKDRFRTLRAGDYVRLEGKFTERDRFELLSFLNDDS